MILLRICTVDLTTDLYGEIQELNPQISNNSKVEQNDNKNFLDNFPDRNSDGTDTITTKDGRKFERSFK